MISSLALLFRLVIWRKYFSNITSASSFSIASSGAIDARQVHEKFATRKIPPNSSIRWDYSGSSTSLILCWPRYPDVWYDLPCRIFNSDLEYDWHFVLFTVYVHYDVVRQKSMILYIHRLGSEHPSSAEVSSRNVKNRVRTALNYIAREPTDCSMLNSCPFIIQLSLYNTVADDN